MTAQPATRTRRVARYLAALMIGTTVMYALLGGFVIYQAYAQQTYSWVLPTLNKPFLKVPTGADDKAVSAFFDYNQLRHLASLQETYFVDPYYLGTMYLIIGVILVTFYALSLSWFSRQRRKGDLYPVEVYNGYITERSGPVDWMNWLLYAVLLCYMVTYTVVNLIGGQYY
jgi:hypothetical protein